MKSPEEIGRLTKQMIGYNLITHQTSEEGLKVNAVLVHEGVDIERQIYLAFLLDRKTQGPVIVCSNKGGMDIEDVAKEHPEEIRTFPIDFALGMTADLALSVCRYLKIEEGA